MLLSLYLRCCRTIPRHMLLSLYLICWRTIPRHMLLSLYLTCWRTIPRHMLLSLYLRCWRTVSWRYWLPSSVGDLQWPTGRHGVLSLSPRASARTYGPQDWEYRNHQGRRLGRWNRQPRHVPFSPLSPSAHRRRWRVLPWRRKRFQWRCPRRSVAEPGFLIHQENPVIC